MSKNVLSLYLLKYSYFVFKNFNESISNCPVRKEPSLYAKCTINKSTCEQKIEVKGYADFYQPTIQAVFTFLCIFLGCSYIHLPSDASTVVKRGQSSTNINNNNLHFLLHLITLHQRNHNGTAMDQSIELLLDIALYSTDHRSPRSHMVENL